MWVIGNILMNSQGHLTNVGPPASGLVMELTTLHHKKEKKKRHVMKWHKGLQTYIGNPE
jgi:hypothetical protein